jgi:isoamylase
MELPYIFEGYRCLPGQPLPLGHSYAIGGLNFAVASQTATACTLVLFDRGSNQPRVEIPLPDEFRFGSVWAITVLGLGDQADDIEYGFRLRGIDGEWSPILLDPNAKAVSGRDHWGEYWPDDNNPYPHRARILSGVFYWDGDRPLNIPREDLVIYEMHVRGFTQHASSGVRCPGTYAGMIEKIPYLKKLGVNAVELLPVWEFDEFEHWYRDEAGQLYLQYWGYSPISFLAPKAGYATGDAVEATFELKALIKALHEAGIEVFFDIVLNHTAEGDEKGRIISYKGIDLPSYYLLTPDGHFYNFSGTGNSVNANHPWVIPHILDCMRYWVTEYHIDGFRFDLASVLTRDVNGTPLNDPPVLRLMSNDPVLWQTKFIAEPWDVGGLYQVGSFPSYGRWSEWNGRYRDALRRFLKGDSHIVGEIAQAVQGYPDMYRERGPIASVNFITAHDGFTLRDLVSYNEKHNDEPGGSDHNLSYNYGEEGETDDAEINAIRRRQMKNALAILFTSLGVPMLLMGDEVARTQIGNNNAYRQDNELSWFDWGLVDENADQFDFTRRLIAFRMAHPALRTRHFYNHDAPAKKLLPPIKLHGVKVGHPDFLSESRALAYMLSGEPQYPGQQPDDIIYVAMNMSPVDLSFDLPKIPVNKRWRLFVNTGEDIAHEPGSEPPLEDQKHVAVASRAVAILVGR